MRSHSLSPILKRPNSLKCIVYIASLSLGLCLIHGSGCEDDSPSDKSPTCDPGAVRCNGNAVEVCLGDGSKWGPPQDCDMEETCWEGRCVPAACDPGETFCAGDSLLTCGSDGASWEEEACPAGWVCAFGGCRECVEDENRGCEEGQICREGVCEPEPLQITTQELPDGMIGELYDVTLEWAPSFYEGTWTVSSGELPSGLSLSNSGVISGTPDATGIYPFGVTLDCGEDGTSDATYEIVIYAEGLVVSTDTLPSGLQGFDYEAHLDALGGTPPYGWMVSEGELPLGLFLTYDGDIFGVPEEVGDFPLTVKVFDDADPPQMAWKDLLLVVDIAPLEIVGDEEYDLLVAKVIVLDMITIVPNIPIPYSTQLQAKGGLKPYSWVETDMPMGTEWIIPQSGIPEGLTLEQDGEIHGSVTTTDQVVTVSIPFSDIEITGFFFAAEVTDSQNPAETASSIFVIPTLPIGG